MSERIKELWTDTNMLLRYVVSGFVVLVVAWAADCKHTVLAEMVNTAGSLWPVLMLGPVFGFVLYSLHSAVCYSFYGFWAYWHSSSHGPGAKKSAKEEYMDVLLRRWEARYGVDAGACARELMVRAWASQIHFLYCSAWALVVTPIVLACFDRDPWVYFPILLGILLFLLAFSSDLRLARLVVSIYVSNTDNVRSQHLDRDAASEDDLGSLGMTNKTENKNSIANWTKDMYLARFLHQDQLMWGRLPTLMAVQTAAIALAFYLDEKSKPAAFIAIGFGFGISLFVCVLYFLDRHWRDKDNKNLGSPHLGFPRHVGLLIFIFIALAFFGADALALDHFGFKFWWGG